ncbi:MAG: GerMN domain-containing protein [Microcoleaceae cyanobacterium]
MKQPHDTRNIPTAALAGASVLILLLGGGIAWWATSRQTVSDPQALTPSAQTPSVAPISPDATPEETLPSPETSPEPLSPIASPEQSAPPATNQPEQSVAEPDTGQTVQKTAEVYWLQDNQGQMELAANPVLIDDKRVDNTTNSQAPLELAFNQLLAEAPDSERFSEIPSETQLISLRSENNSEVYVNLSPEFTQGGGSSSMIARLGQVIYTATSLNPEAKVWISVNGDPLTLLGGEGLEVPQPSTRANFNAEFQME